jgi:hypothetical protein
MKARGTDLLLELHQLHARPAIGETARAQCRVRPRGAASGMFIPAPFLSNSDLGIAEPSRIANDRFLT